MATETHESTGAAEHEGGSGGLPQFDPQWWPGQIVWLLIIFVVVMTFMRVFAVPKLGGTITARDEKIAGDIAAARRLKDEAEAQAAAAAAERAQARAEVGKVALEARAKAQAEIAAALAEQEAKLAETTGAAEAGIAAERDRAMASVAGIASEIAQAMVQKLTGRAASAAELAQAAKG
jgi:F-type H+-transporting ATPase subunit b